MSRELKRPPVGVVVRRGGASSGVVLFKITRFVTKSLRVAEQCDDIQLKVTLGAGVHVLIFRSSGQSNTKLPVFSYQASLVLIYRRTEGMKG
ncbi:hypothetical protein TNCV_4527951 [Trichonephila clavipes]|nr:hypothetical protein TNCV_4527951 [Trichonephila clavipes]